jgi:hypothetical protein
MCGQSANGTPSKHRATRAYVDYVIARVHLSSFFMLVHSTVPTMGRISAAINKGEMPAELGADFADVTRMWGKFCSDLRPCDFTRLVDEIHLCRAVDTFSKYLTEVLLLTFLKKPETLKTSDTVKIVDVLNWGSSEEIVRKLAERKVDSLNYESFDDLLGYLRTKLGLEVDVKDEVLQLVREGIEVRNIIVHCSRVVSSTFLRRTQRRDMAEGDLFPLDMDYVIKVGDANFALAQALDRAFVAQFDLPPFTGTSQGNG